MGKLKIELTLTLAVLALTVVPSAGRAQVLRVVREPRLVPSVSSKTEKAWAPCAWCGSRVSYERTYRWDPYDRRWIETTASAPELCRKCRGKEKSREKLAREEAALDRKLEYKEAKRRVAEKRALLRNQGNGRADDIITRIAPSETRGK